MVQRHSRATRQQQGTRNSDGREGCKQRRCDCDRDLPGIRECDSGQPDERHHEDSEDDRPQPIQGIAHKGQRAISCIEKGQRQQNKEARQNEAGTGQDAAPPAGSPGAFGNSPRQMGCDPISSLPVHSTCSIVGCTVGEIAYSR